MIFVILQYLLKTLVHTRFFETSEERNDHLSSAGLATESECEVEIRPASPRLRALRVLSDLFVFIPYPYRSITLLHSYVICPGCPVHP